jgi:hypothetical protein
MSSINGRSSLKMTAYWNDEKRVEKQYNLIRLKRIEEIEIEIFQD